MALTPEQLNELHQIRKWGEVQKRSPNLKQMSNGDLTSQLADDALQRGTYTDMAEMKPVIKENYKSSLMDRIKALGEGTSADFTVKNQSGAALAPALAEMALLYGAEKAVHIPEAGAGSDTLPTDEQILKDRTNEAHKKLIIQQMISSK